MKDEQYEQALDELGMEIYVAGTQDDGTSKGYPAGHFRARMKKINRAMLERASTKQEAIDRQDVRVKEEAEQTEFEMTDKKKFPPIHIVPGT